MLNTAVKAARRAGNIITRASRDLDALNVEMKGHNDFVSEVDKTAEEAIIKVLLEAYPDHAILAEESGVTGKSEYVWIIDPLDGTTNFLHGFPQYAVSIALAHKGKIMQGVVYDPNRNELFTASRGKGAYLNDKRLRVSKRPQLKEALIGTGFPFRKTQQLDAYMGMFRKITEKAAGIRRPGAAALDLAYVAAGYFDGFWEVGLAPWDVAAGSLMVQEAGGLIGNLDGSELDLNLGNVIAGNPKIFAQLVDTISPLAANLS